MAEEYDQTAIESQDRPVTPATSRTWIKKRSTKTRPTRPTAARRHGPVRSLVILTMVGGLVATVAIPAYAASTRMPIEDSQTLQQMSAVDAQSLVVASDASGTELARDSYSATTEDEINKKKAAEAAAARARAQAAAAAASSSVSSVPVNINLVSPGTGEVRWPILNFTKGRGIGDSGYHQGVDLLAPGGTPLYAAAAGVVRIAQEAYGGYGVAVVIDHVIAGQRVSTLYGHMTYGSRQVVAGQSVEAGQLIGLVGSTGSSTANHLHFEVRVNNGLVDPWAWLVANAG
ncbi:M23 family metallopeptidase [Microbacterium sp. NPDC055442]